MIDKRIPNPFGITKQEITAFLDKQSSNGHAIVLDNRLAERLGVIDIEEIAIIFISSEMELWSMCYLPRLHHIGSFCKKKRIRKKNIMRIAREYRRENRR